VHEHIGVGVSGEPSLIGDFDAAQDELAPWGKLMKVYSDADAHGISIILSGAEIRETIISLGFSIQPASNNFLSSLPYEFKAVFFNHITVQDIPRWAQVQKQEVLLGLGQHY
jgi:hypothetical protein